MSDEIPVAQDKDTLHMRRTYAQTKRRKVLRADYCDRRKGVSMIKMTICNIFSTLPTRC